MKVILYEIDDIKPYKDNPRKNENAVDVVAESIKKYGFRQPIVIDKDGVIIAGHTRWLAARKLGLKKVPVHIASDLTPEQTRAYRLIDNRTADFAEWDIEKLKTELDALIDNKELNFLLKNYDFDKLIQSESIEKQDITKETIYSQKIEVPVYKPMQENPPAINELYDITIYKQKLKQIEETGIKDKKLIEFLQLAATRFIKFNFQNIAEYYAHQPAEVQDIMEKLVLVIIDIKNAIANGMVVIHKKIKDIMADEILSEDLDE